MWSFRRPKFAVCNKYITVAAGEAKNQMKYDLSYCIFSRIGIIVIWLCALNFYSLNTRILIFIHYHTYRIAYMCAQPEIHPPLWSIFHCTFFFKKLITMHFISSKLCLNKLTTEFNFHCYVKDGQKSNIISQKHINVY